MYIYIYIYCKLKKTNQCEGGQRIRIELEILSLERSRESDMKQIAAPNRRLFVSSLDCVFEEDPG